MGRNYYYEAWLEGDIQIYFSENALYIRDSKSETIIAFENRDYLKDFTRDLLASIMEEFGEEILEEVG